MKKVLFYSLLFFALISIAGCQKSIDSTGDLVINARDGVGASLVGTTVYLYDNQYDYDNFLYSETQITNNSGQVRFEYLTPGVYYFECDFENNYGEIVTISGSGAVFDGNETTVTIMP
ncbi:MAG: hypothetical protein GZ094_18330 [Mariniphaga sp.]|nr:hypothetical protein [Mariniphaga sp.]